jgi:hypothetical protein
MFLLSFFFFFETKPWQYSMLYFKACRIFSHEVETGTLRAKDMPSTEMDDSIHDTEVSFKNSGKIDEVLVLMSSMFCPIGRN